MSSTYHILATDLDVKYNLNANYCNNNKVCLPSTLAEQHVDLCDSLVWRSIGGNPVHFSPTYQTQSINWHHQLQISHTWDLKRAGIVKQPLHAVIEDVFRGSCTKANCELHSPFSPRIPLTALCKHSFILTFIIEYSLLTILWSFCQENRCSIPKKIQNIHMQTLPDNAAVQEIMNVD